MQKTMTTLTELKLVGITTRTNNAHIFERDPSTNEIAATVQKYFHNGFDLVLVFRTVHLKKEQEKRYLKE